MQGKQAAELIHQQSKLITAHLRGTPTTGRKF